MWNYAFVMLYFPWRRGTVMICPIGRDFWWSCNTTCHRAGGDPSIKNVLFNTATLFQSLLFTAPCACTLQRNFGCIWPSFLISVARCITQAVNSCLTKSVFFICTNINVAHWRELKHTNKSNCCKVKVTHKRELQE